MKVKLKIDEYGSMFAVFAYNNQFCRPTYVIYQGCSSELVGIGPETATVKLANGDAYIVPTSELHMRGAL